MPRLPSLCSVCDEPVDPYDDVCTFCGQPICYRHSLSTTYGYTTYGYEWVLWCESCYKAEYEEGSRGGE